MYKLLSRLFRIIYCILSICSVQVVAAQSLKLTDFAVWGGGAPSATYNNSQGVFIGNIVSITGNVGSNHRVKVENFFNITGNVYSDNVISLGNFGRVAGNIFAAKNAANYTGNVIESDLQVRFEGNLTAKGKILLRNLVWLNGTAVTGQVAVPAPSSTNYSGPVPAGGVVNTLTFPVLPSMPTNTPFDSQVGTTNITNTQTILPGKYRKLALSGNKTVTFSGPGNYIFNEVDNASNSNKLVFDFKNTTTGTINIFVIKDAKWGRLSVRTINGNFPSRIYTEVHGNGLSNGGDAFDIVGPVSIPDGSNIWLGNVWAPNGGIAVKSLNPFNAPHIIGALWSAKKVALDQNLKLVYQAPAVGVGPGFIEPYYPPPVAGKVNTGNNIIGAELLSLSQNPSPITSIPENEIFRFDSTGKVMIEVVSKTANDNVLKAQLAALGMTDTVNNGPHIFIITGFFPINKLSQLNSNPRIEYVRPLYPPISNAGQVTTQGDTTMRSHYVKERFGLDGSGVKIGVISDSYNSKLEAQNDVDQGDLPGIKSNGQSGVNSNPVQVLADFKGNDEGRAMLQIVHDVAPKSTLAFRTGFLTAGDFAKGIEELAAPNQPGGRCDVIVDDITYVTEPFLRDGIVAKTVDKVAAQGIAYFSSAGNFGVKSYESTFTGVTNTSVIPNGQIHRFGSTAADIYQTINLKPGTYTIVLQWSDEFHSLGSVAGVQTDMDLYLVGTSGFTLFGFNRSNLFGDPFEVCPFTVKEETNAKVMVVRAAGTGNVRFKYIIFRGDGTIMDYQSGASSIVGHPNANGAIAVGAMLYANIPPFTPVYPGVASFSSRGGTFTLNNGNFTARNKPDLIGPNGVNTTVNLGSAPFNDGDNYPNFFGTSAAAPHVAAVGALLIQGRKKFSLQTTVTPSEIRQQLQSSAGKFSYLPGNFSFEGGYGYVQADSAAQQFANARPIIDSLKAATPGAQNGNQPFVVKIKGRYLTDSTQIYVGGAPVATTISSDKTEATATIPAIAPGQDPAFQLFNSAKSPSGVDGGLSEALHFFSSRIEITVRPANKSRKYGQSNPSFTTEILYNGVLMTNPDTLAKLKLDGGNVSFTTIATPTSNAGLYGIFPSRTTPLANNDPLLAQYGFTFVSGTLTVEKMPLKITPQNKQIKYGEYPGNIVYNYEFTQSPANSATLLEEVRALHKKYLADNALVVINGFNNQTPAITQSDLANMSTMASFQSVRNARKFVLQNGQLQALVNNINPSQLGDQRFIVDVAAQSLLNYKLDSANSPIVQSAANNHARGFLNIKALTSGTAKASVPNGQLQAIVNGQLLAMVNGQLQALVNGQLQALVNGVYVTATDVVFQNGQLLALVNGVWVATTNGQLQAIVNNAPVTVELSIANGQLQAIVNGQLMALVNGQLQAIVNGQLLAIVNGQLQAIVNGQLMPLVNGQLVAIVNGQLQPIVNGQLVALVNGQLMALVNGQLQIVQNLTLSNGQLQAIVNRQLQPIVNGQLKALVNGVVTDIPNPNINLVNGQLQAIVNGQLQALVNGQLLAIVNGQLQPIVNGEAVAVESVKQLANGQLQALVNGTYIPITNGQLQAIVNGQLLAMVNGQLMAIVNGELTFAVFSNGQLQALVNGQLQPLVNGQLQAIVNGQLQQVNSYSITNGQLQAIVNGQTLAYANGQLLALVNGQLQPLVNNFDVRGTNNNAKTLVLIDEDDINLQSGDVGGMFSINMITGLNAGIQTLIPGSFVNENYEVSYGLGQVEISKAPLIAKATDTTKAYGDANPSFTISYSGFAYNETASSITAPTATTTATANSNVGTYPITLSGGSSANYSFGLYLPGTLTIAPRTLTVIADNKTKAPGDSNPPLTITYNGLAGDDTRDSVCVAFTIPSSPKVIDQRERFTTYTGVRINNGSNVIYATPGQSLTLTGSWNEKFYTDSIPGYVAYCPGCITQNYIGMNNAEGLGTIFTDCYDVSGLAPHSGVINKAFTAPTTPGVYYITQVSSWEFGCYDNGTGNPGNDRNNAIAVVIVNYPGFPNQNITASTTATQASPAGTYPITLQGCNSNNPNYNVVLQNGTLTIGEAITARTSNSDAIVLNQTIETVEEKNSPDVDRLYPNPAISFIKLQLKEGVLQTSAIQVYDGLGKLARVAIRKVNEKLYDINVSALSKGVYYLKVKTVTGLATFKFIKI
jgi:cytoskeletal protein CcmA (bactofilin family)